MPRSRSSKLGNDARDASSLATQMAQSASNANSKEINVLYPPVPLVALAGDGVTDDSTALQNIINSLTIGSVLLPPNKTYLVGDVVLKAGITITTRSNRSAGYSGTSGMACLKAKSGATYILKGASFSGYSIDGIFFDGNSKATHGISSGMSSGTIKNCVFNQCNIGFGNFNVDYAGSTVIENCTFKNCNTGISNIRDSRVINNFFYSNALRGIYLPSGANDNIIALNKIEWNSGYGVEGYQSDHNTIELNIYDRNSKAGIKLASCTNCSIGGTFRRNGADTTGADADQSQIRLESCTDITFGTTVTLMGNSQDDGSGTNVPKYTLYTLNNNGLNYLNADLNGYATSQTNSSGDTNVLNKDTIRYFDRKKITVNTTATYTGLTLTGGRSVSTFDRSHRRLKVVGRNNSTGSSYYGEKIIMIKRDSGNASVETGASQNFAINGGSTTFLDGLFTFANFTTDATGTYITFDVTNTTAYNMDLIFTFTD